MFPKDIKVGDRVRCTSESCGWRGPRKAIEGETAVVRRCDPDSSYVLLQFDNYSPNRAASSGHDIPLGHAGLFHKAITNYIFEKVGAARKSGKTWIIVVVQDGKLAPAKEPVEYCSAEQARKVAHEMAEKHPGNEFYVFEAVGMAKAVKTAYTAL